ncbi:MAG: hypothetical protein MUF72_03900 [Elainella sp. Prado103]|jgi:hypothetical protein|nr:hypothetical protein [Elainella sp. Prado103]
MGKINRNLFRTLGLSWIGFVGVGLMINLLLPLPVIAVLVDRSYCPPADWVQVVQQYEQLYRQHQQGHLKIQQVIVFSDLGEEVLSPVPPSETIQTLSTYGRPNPARQSELATKYPTARLLECN